MHCLYFVIFNREDAKNSHQARLHAENTLLNENFCSSEGFFGGGKADWFSIGGGCSGELNRILLGLSPDDKKKFQAAWKNAGIKEPIPYERNNYQEMGYEDDAMIIDQKLFDGLQKMHSDVEIYDANDYREDTLSDFSAEELIGHWIVVIDYHC